MSKSIQPFVRLTSGLPLTAYLPWSIRYSLLCLGRSIAIPLCERKIYTHIAYIHGMWRWRWWGARRQHASVCTSVARVCVCLCLSIFPSENGKINKHHTHRVANPIRTGPTRYSFVWKNHFYLVFCFALPSCVQQFDQPFLPLPSLYFNFFKFRFLLMSLFFLGQRWSSPCLLTPVSSSNNTELLFDVVYMCMWSCLNHNNRITNQRKHQKLKELESNIWPRKSKKKNRKIKRRRRNKISVFKLKIIY